MPVPNKPFAYMAADVNALAPMLRKTSAILQMPCVGYRHECKCQNVGRKQITTVLTNRYMEKKTKLQFRERK